MFIAFKYKIEISRTKLKKKNYHQKQLLWSHTNCILKLYTHTHTKERTNRSGMAAIKW